nr:EOG090X0971 [Cyclestheria hislopi]
MSVVIETTKGDITVDLYTKERPKTCLNFLKLCKVKAYNFCLFHLVERNFLAQTGDPTGTGRGGESIYGKLYGEQAKFYEAEQIPTLKHVKPGTLSMVNVGDNMLGSQFFITLGENLDYLDKEHCVFGEVVEGHDTLLKINDAICDENNVPYQDIRITYTIILDDPFDDPRGLEIPDRSPELTREIIESGRIGADEEIDETVGKSAEEVEEMIAEKEAKARATILEMVGDLPDADVAPPENVLFVCKLNPVTTDDDLMVIFSRFGKIVSCEIIRDRVTGNSLQYAFIEFDNPKSCEDAYFKMDNVLIDDRRIHVDFSQSVSRIQWRGKGRGVQFSGGKAFDPNKEDYRSSKTIKEEGVSRSHRRDRSRSRDDDRTRTRQDERVFQRDRHRRDERTSSYKNDRRNSSRRFDDNRHYDRYRNQRSDYSSRYRNRQDRSPRGSSRDRSRNPEKRDLRDHRSDRKREDDQFRDRESSKGSSRKSSERHSKKRRSMSSDRDSMEEKKKSKNDNIKRRS